MSQSVAGTDDPWVYSIIFLSFKVI